MANACYNNVMKYTIFINQSVMSETKLDIKDAAMLDYLKSFCSVDDKKMKQITMEENGMNYRYTWINFKHLISEMPLLGIKQKASISERMSKIEKEGFIKTFRAPDRSLYVRLMPKIRDLDFRRGVSINEQGVSQDEHEVLAQTNSTNNTSDNNNIINNIATQSVAGSDMQRLLDLFKEVNPSYARLFPNKNQRAALERIIKIHGIDKTEKIIKLLPASNRAQYAPTITTPIDLENKLGALAAYWQKQKGRGSMLIRI